ncbi:MAG TPA: hypothetical protein VGO03_05265 [Acidimicrobiia bacterium]
MSRAARAPGRRPIAEFFAYAREQPNQALAVGLGAVVVIALAIFGIVHFTGGSSQPARAAAGAGAGGGNGAQIGPANGGGSSAGGGGSSASTPTNSGTSPSGTSGHSPTTSSGGSHTSAPRDHSATPTTLFVLQRPTDTAGPTIRLAKSEQKWVASPSSIHMKAGASDRGWVVVVNLTDHKGIVDAPGCSGPPSATPAPRTSCGGASTIVVQPHGDVKVMWTWHATQTGRAGAPPLAPGSYFFAIGPVNVHVTVK